MIIKQHNHNTNANNGVYAAAAFASAISRSEGGGSSKYAILSIDTGAKLAKPALQRGKGKGKSVDTFLTLAPGSNPQVKKVVSFLAT